jgi:hypothetical protein
MGFLPCGGDGGEDLLMAVLRPESDHLQYHLHMFSSKENTWTTRLALLEPTYPGYKEDDYLVNENDMVITLEGGLLGCFDLWRGILLCNVIDTNPVVRYMGGNMCRYLRISGGAVRDVTFSDGTIKLIEMEDKKRLYAAARVSNGQLRHNHSESSAPKDLKMAGPIWSMHDGDVVYLMAKAKTEDKHVCAIAFNIRKSTLDGVTSFLEERHFPFKLAYRPFILSKYLNMASYNSRGT